MGLTAATVITREIEERRCVDVLHGMFMFVSEQPRFSILNADTKKEGGRRQIFEVGILEKAQRYSKVDASTTTMVHRSRADPLRSRGSGDPIETICTKLFEMVRNK